MRLFFALCLLACLLSCTKGNEYRASKPEVKEISGTVDILEEQKPVYYKISAGGIEIDFFIIKINGEVRAYLDRCMKCFNSGKGFGFEDYKVRCKACNERFPIEKIVGGIGSCYPIPVAVRVTGNRYSVTSESVTYSYQNKKPKI